MSARLLAEPLLKPTDSINLNHLYSLKEKLPGTMIFPTGPSNKPCFFRTLSVSLSVVSPEGFAFLSLERALEWDYQCIHKLPFRLFWDIKPCQDVLPCSLYWAVVFYIYIKNSQEFSWKIRWTDVWIFSQVWSWSRSESIRLWLSETFCTLSIWVLVKFY